MHVFRPLGIVAVVLIAATPTSSLARADILDFCPAETKSVWLLDIAKLQATDAAKAVSGGGSLYEFFHRKIESRFPEIEKSWSENPHQKILDDFGRSTSKFMLCDFGGFLNFCLCFEGEFDEERLRKILEDYAAGKKAELETTVRKTTVRKNYVLFEIGEEAYALVEGKVLVISYGDNRDFALGHLEKRSDQPTAVRSNAAVRQALRDPAVCFAYAIEDANRALIGTQDRRYDFETGIIAVREAKFDIRVNRSHDTAQQAVESKMEFGKSKDDAVNASVGTPLVEPLRAVMVESHEKNVVVEGSIPAAAVRESLDFLLDKIFK
jgi:hypothetical protein